MADDADKNISASKILPKSSDYEESGKLKDVGSPPSPFLGLEDYVNFEGYPRFRRSAVMYENALYRYRILRVLPMIDKAKNFMFNTDAFKKEICHILTKNFDFEKSELSKSKRYGEGSVNDVQQCMDSGCPIHPDNANTIVDVEKVVKKLAEEKPSFMCSELNRIVDLDRYPAYKTSVEHYNGYLTADADRHKRWASSYHWQEREARNKFNEENPLPDWVEDPMKNYEHLKGDISDLIAKYSFILDPEYGRAPHNFNKDNGVEAERCQNQDSSLKQKSVGVPLVYAQSSTMENSLEPDKTPSNSASDPALDCLQMASPILSRNSYVQGVGELNSPCFFPHLGRLNTPMTSFTNSPLGAFTRPDFGVNLKSSSSQLDYPQVCRKSASVGTSFGNMNNAALEPRFSCEPEWFSQGMSPAISGLLRPVRDHINNSGVIAASSSRDSTIPNRERAPQGIQYSQPQTFDNGRGMFAAGPPPCSKEPLIHGRENRHMMCECQKCKMHNHMIKFSVHFPQQLQNQNLYASNSPRFSPALDESHPNQSQFQKQPETHTTPTIPQHMPQNVQCAKYESPHPLTSHMHGRARPRSRSRSSSISSRSSRYRSHRHSPYRSRRQFRDRYGDRQLCRSRELKETMADAGRKSFTRRFTRSRSPSWSSRSRRRSNRAVQATSTSASDKNNDKYSANRETGSRYHGNYHSEKSYCDKDRSRPKSQHNTNWQYSRSSNRRYQGNRFLESGHRGERR